MFKKMTITALSLFSAFAFSQATFEQSYTISQVGGGAQTFFFNTETGSFHYTFDASNVLRIYTETHSIFATINLPVDAGYTITNILLFTDKLFNNDSLIEFVLVTRSPPGDVYKMTLVNQNATVLQQFGDKTGAFVVKTLSNNYKLITEKGYTGPSPYFTSKDVYSLTGTLSANQSGMLSKVIAYPNPVKDVINITNPSHKTENTSLKVYSISGELVLQQNIANENEDFIKLDVSNLQSGVYIYKIHDITSKFIKE